MFKKNKINKVNDTFLKQKGLKKSKLSVISFFVGFLFSALIFFVWISIIWQIGNKNFQIQDILNVPETNFTSLLTGSGSDDEERKTWKVNILIVGRWGSENDAPDLSDTIILASLNYDKNTVSMFSIPRDLYVKYPTGGIWKINETYLRWYKQSKSKQDGVDAIKEVVSNITGEKVNYYINIDFAGFRKLIDTIGGIEIDVPEAIVDTSYPGPKHTYIVFRVNKGLQKMNGETALRYSRSRHSTSDFDRSLRQQLVIKAIREKVLSLGVLTNPLKIKGIYDVLESHIVSDMNVSSIISFAMYAKEIPKDNIFSSNLNNTCVAYSLCEKGWFLYTPPREDYGWAAILIQEWATSTTLNKYEQINKYANIALNYPLLTNEQMEINVFNGTKITWLAEKYVRELIRYGFTLPKTNYAGNTGWDKYEKSKILYYSSGSEVPETVKALEELIPNSAEKLTIEHKYSTNAKTKIEIIIGNDYKTLNF